MHNQNIFDLGQQGTLRVLAEGHTRIACIAIMAYEYMDSIVAYYAKHTGSGIGYLQSMNVSRCFGFAINKRAGTS